MKILAFILSVYFLTLGVMPCEDGVALEKSNEYVQVDQGDGHSHEGFDDCSPFCQCHCCHVHVVTVATTAFETVDLPISTLIIQKGQLKGFELPSYHFQPPRV